MPSGGLQLRWYTDGDGGVASILSEVAATPSRHVDIDGGQAHRSCWLMEGASFECR